MPCRTPLLIPALAAALAAQSGTPPKASAQDYPARASLEKLSIGADYLVHSFSSGREMFIAKDYLVVEVALFPARDTSVMVSAAHFALRINGHKTVVAPEGPEIVAASLRFPDTNSGLHTVEAVGPVVFGEPRPTERFPGDPTARTPPPPPVPSNKPANLADQKPITPEELVVQAALAEGEHRESASGFMYFPYRGKVTRIRSLELIYAGPAGNATLPLSPVP